MMTKRYLLTIDTIAPLVLAAGIGVLFAYYTAHKSQPPKVYLPAMQIQASPTPTPTQIIQKPFEVSQISPDGTKKLTMTVTINNNLAETYTFATSDIDGNNRQVIYTGTYTNETMSIPFNAWSPDDTYVFLLYTTPTQTQALVLRADGQPFTPEEPYFNAADIFTAKNTGETYHETTGWASDTLLIVNTTSQDGSKGPSYWLEIPDKAVIQLSSQF